MAPRQPNNTEELLRQLLEKLDTHTDNLNDGQDKLSDRFENLSKTYAELAARLTHVEAKDFNSAITKIDSSSQKILLLENNVKDCLEEQDAVSETLSGIKIKFEKLEAKIDRIQIYINIVAFVMASIIAPLLVAYISKILIGG
jgi:uncharacterized phage infection (PIP) family protein YhgE